ncbi:MAG: class I adenylate-forming enzyme family protein [Solirubrobacteraceae bacterium]
MEHWLLRAARVRGERPALTGPGGDLSYARLRDEALAVAGALAQRGIGVGDRVALALPSRDLVVALHGCLLAGATAVPIDLRLGPVERELRCDGATLVLEELPAGPAPGAIAPYDGDRAATLMFTSGTTATPKPVALSCDNWLWNALGSALALGLDPAERWLCPMPLAHVGGLSIQLRCAIYATTVVLHDRFDTDRCLGALMDPELRVTLVSLVPTMLSRLLDAGLREPPSLRRVLLGGGPIAPALLERAGAAGVAVSPSYGMTETCSQLVTDGIPLLGAELRVAGDGELLVRGPSVARGALAADGWLHTGDLGSLDEHGTLSITGRKADTIVTGGENVAPAEVEAVLLAHPTVLDVAVVGRADPEWGEAVVALVVPTPGATVDRRALREHCAARLAPFKIPKRFEEMAALPRGATGKLLRREL